MLSTISLLVLSANADPSFDTKTIDGTTCGDKFQSCFVSKCCSSPHAFGCFKKPDKQFALCKPLSSQDNVNNECVDTADFLCPSSWLASPPPPVHVLLEETPPANGGLETVKAEAALAAEEDGLAGKAKAKFIAEAILHASDLLDDASDLIDDLDEGLFDGVEASGLPFVVVVGGIAIGAAVLACLLMACCCISCHRAKERQQFQAEMSVLFEQEVARREKLEQEKSLAAQQQLRSFIQPPTPTTEQVVTPPPWEEMAMANEIGPLEDFAYLKRGGSVSPTAGYAV